MSYYKDSEVPDSSIDLLVTFEKVIGTHTVEDVIHASGNLLAQAIVHLVLSVAAENRTRGEPLGPQRRREMLDSFTDEILDRVRHTVEANYVGGEPPADLIEVKIREH